MQIDHIDPVVPVNMALAEMSFDTIVDRTWCEEVNLQAICKPCHALKTLKEAKERATERKKRK